MLVSTRTTNLLLVVVVAIGIGVIAMLASGAWAGPLDPPSAPGSSGTLPQVEPRMPIPPVGWNGTFPIVINQAGSYFLTRSLTTPGGVDGITVTSDNVTIDLDGFTLDGTDYSHSGIEGNGPMRVRVLNGMITRFASGVAFGPSGSSVQVSDVNVWDFGAGTGISVPQWSVVEGCVVGLGFLHGAGSGVQIGAESAMRNCSVSDVGGDGVSTGPHSVVEDNVVIEVCGSGSCYGIRAVGLDVTVRNNSLDNETHDIGVGGSGTIIVGNVIHCPTSIVNLGAFSYYAPVNGEEDANQPRYAAGFC